MSDPEICYKVVLSLDGNIRSSMHSEFFPTVYYIEGQKVAAKVGKLFVFKDSILAYAWWRQNSTEDVWLAHGENLKPIDYCLFWGIVPRHYEEFWWLYEMSPEQAYGYSGVVEAPLGTYVSDSITLIRRLTHL